MNLGKAVIRSFIAALLLAGWGASAFAADSLGFVAVRELPVEARQTLALIKQGGPFPFHRDGVVFGNYQHILPQHPRGYYHEYTVPTPGASSRGGRRIVVGGNTVASEYFYTGDHYRTFKRIQE